jgi:hypothetical protein
MWASDMSPIVLKSIVPVSSLHTTRTTRSIWKDGIWTFTCNDCGKHFPIPQAELREAMLPEAWLTLHYPQAARHLLSDYSKETPAATKRGSA